jgi:cytochrome subunit of sulfide dehydrogenase
MGGRALPCRPGAMLWPVLIILASLAGTVASAAGREPAALANACASCHGPDGRSQGAIPSLAGMPAADFVAKMAAFRSGGGDATVMDRIAPGVSPAEVDALADYFSQLH